MVYMITSKKFQIPRTSKIRARFLKIIKPQVFSSTPIPKTVFSEAFYTAFQCFV